MQPAFSASGVPLFNVDGTPMICKDGGGCCGSAADTCNIPGTRPGDLQVTIPSNCPETAGVYLLDNNASSDDPSLPSRIDDLLDLDLYCWFWWFDGGAGIWYFLGIQPAISPSFKGTPFLFATKDTVPIDSQQFFASPVLSNWSEMDGLELPSQAQTGDLLFSCPFPISSPALVELSP